MICYENENKQKLEMLQNKHILGMQDVNYLLLFRCGRTDGRLDSGLLISLSILDPVRGVN